MYKIDNRPKKHSGMILVLGIVLGIGIAIGGYFWFENTPNLIRVVGQVSENVTSQVKSLSQINYNNAQQVQASQQVTDLRSIALQIHNLVNDERISNGLPQLSWNDQISNVATAYSQYMLVNNHYDHVDLNGNHANYRMTQSGVICGNNWAENLDWIDGGSNSFSSNDILSDWLSDSGHKANLLDPNVTEEGVGIFTDGKQTYITEDFCSSSS